MNKLINIATNTMGFNNLDDTIIIKKIKKYKLINNLILN